MLIVNKHMTYGLIEPVHYLKIFILQLHLWHRKLIKLNIQM